MRFFRRIPPERAVILATLALVAVNIAVTGRWAGVPGALRGWRWPFLAVAIVVTAVLALQRPRPSAGLPRWLPAVVAALGAVVMAVWLLGAWFPPAEWHLIPFLDDWPPRYLSTVDGVRLLQRGAFSGWEWNLLGGYSTATDITQSLALLGAVPMTLFGDPVGFHLLHIALFCAVPLLVLQDLRRSGAGASAAIACGFVALALVGNGWTLVRSGDTNSLAGTFAVLVVLAASRRARSRARVGFTGLVAALSLAVFAHIGFFLYAVGLLAVEAVYYRDVRHLRRALAAAALAGVVSLPLTYELLRYPGRFIPNNVMFVPPAQIDWIGVLRNLAYNVEILFLPSRWFNDPSGLTSLLLPILLLMAWTRQGRLGFYAWGALFAFVLLRFNVPEAGYVFARPEHLLVVFTPVAVAGFVATRAADRRLATSLVVVVTLCFQVAWFTLPHLRSVEDFVPGVVARLETLDGNLVVVENNPHRDVTAPSTERSERSLYGTHYEALLPSATGKRLYAGYWDGWQWTPSRGEMLAGGAWKGRLLSGADQAAFVAEMRRWGARHALVWSSTARTAFSSWQAFELRWSHDPWHHFELADQPADTRSVVVEPGAGALVSTTPLGGVVQLTGVRRGALVTVRTRFHPAWSVTWNGASRPALDREGQLAFLAPADGSYDVTLVYPARRWALALGLATLLLVALVEIRARPALAAPVEP